MAIKCPICKTAVDEGEIGKAGSFFPFCSDRCRLIDLGRWLDGKYAIPVSDKEDAAAAGDEGDGRRERE